MLARTLETLDTAIRSPNWSASSCYLGGPQHTLVPPATRSRTADHNSCWAAGHCRPAFSVLDRPRPPATALRRRRDQPGGLCPAAKRRSVIDGLPLPLVCLALR